MVDAVLPVAAGSAGRDVSGVGSGGKGFERTPANMESIPSVVLL